MGRIFRRSVKRASFKASHWWAHRSPAKNRCPLEPPVVLRDRYLLADSELLAGWLWLISATRQPSLARLVADGRSGRPSKSELDSAKEDRALAWQPSIPTSTGRGVQVLADAAGAWSKQMHIVKCMIHSMNNLSSPILMKLRRTPHIGPKLSRKLVDGPSHQRPMGWKCVGELHSGQDRRT